MSAADRIRLARRTKGLSQAALAALVGVQRSAVTHWESRTGKRPTVEHLIALARTTNVDFEWLATGRGDSKIAPDVLLDATATAHAILVEDELEMRLVRSWRVLPPRGKLAVLEMMELLTS